MAAAQANRRICWRGNNKTMNYDGGTLLLSDSIEFCIVKFLQKNQQAADFFI
jgi:hypothetical protein